MNDYLPKEIRAGLEMARKAQERKKSRLRVRVGDEEFRILRFWEDGFAMEFEDAPHLRGLVDVYDGAKHLSRCLIVASAEEGGEMTFEFKRATAITDKPPRDYEVADDAPVALIPRL